MPIKPLRKPLAKRSHQCRVAPKGAYYKHPTTRETPVNISREPMWQPDTRSFNGVQATQADIDAHIAKHGVQRYTHTGRRII